MSLVGGSNGTNLPAGTRVRYAMIWDDPRKRGGDRWIMVTHELAAEARRCLPHVEDEGVRYILQRIADCYPAPEEPTLPMEGE